MLIFWATLYYVVNSIKVTGLLQIYIGGFPSKYKKYLLRSSPWNMICYLKYLSSKWVGSMYILIASRKEKKFIHGIPNEGNVF